MEVQAALQCVMGAWQAAETRDPGEQPICRALEGSFRGKSWANTVLGSRTSSSLGIKEIQDSCFLWRITVLWIKMGELVSDSISMSTKENRSWCWQRKDYQSATESLKMSGLCMSLKSRKGYCVLSGDRGEEIPSHIRQDVPTEVWNNLRDAWPDTDQVTALLQDEVPLAHVWLETEDTSYISFLEIYLRCVTRTLEVVLHNLLICSTRSVKSLFSSW